MADNREKIVAGLKEAIAVVKGDAEPARVTTHLMSDSPYVLEANGTFNCPICGHDKPHAHSEEQVTAYRQDAIRDDGWTSTVHKLPPTLGYYLIKDFALPEQYSVYEQNIATLAKWRRPTWGGAPEVAEYHPGDPYWFQLLYHPLANNRFEPGYLAARVAPKFWRPLPADKPLSASPAIEIMPVLEEVRATLASSAGCQACLQCRTGASRALAALKKLMEGMG